MLVPANPAAEQVARLRGVNDDIREQIAQLEKSIEANDGIIAAFEPIGEWTELPEPEPEPVPEFAESPSIEVLPREEPSPVPAEPVPAA